MKVTPSFLVSYSITTRCNLWYKYCCSEAAVLCRIAELPLLFPGPFSDEGHESAGA